VSIRKEIYEQAFQNSIAMSRFDTASHLQKTMTYLNNKSWTPQQLPFVQALVGLLKQEEKTLIELGLYELSRDCQPKENTVG